MNANAECLLYVEDEDTDVFLMRSGLVMAGITLPLRVANHGQEAIDYLLGKGDFADREVYPFPKLMLLDLKLPGVNGFDVLHWVRDQPTFRSLKIVVFSSSKQMIDIRQAYRLGANSYYVKPLGVGARVDILKEIKSYFLDEVRNAAGDNYASPIVSPLSERAPDPDDMAIPAEQTGNVQPGHFSLFRPS
jgi:CheY-like chemotaxis protein